MRRYPDANGASGAEEGAPVDAAVLDAAADWVVRRDAGFAAGEEQALQAWLAADARHRAAWARLDSAWSAMDRPRRAGAADRVIREIGARISRRRRRRLAGAIGGLAVAGLLGLFWRAERRPEAAPSPAPTVVVTQPTRRVLPDGSVVELKDDAEIAVDFSGALRRVALRRGEALFRVAKNAQRPFVVRVGGLEVRAVGTEFSVEFGSDEIGVLVTEGRVAVNQAESGQNGQRVPAMTLAFVDAGNRVTVRSGSLSAQPPRVVPLSRSEMGERLAWLSARLEFSNTPLAEAVALMNRHNRLQFVIGDDSLAGLRLSGFIRADNAEAFAGFLEAGFPVKAERRGGNEIVLSRAP